MNTVPHLVLDHHPDLHGWMWDHPLVTAERKYDGWRIVIEGAHSFSRQEKLLSLPFTAMPPGVVVDGELVARQGLQQGANAISRWIARDQSNLELFLFDIMCDRDGDCTRLPLRDRKARLLRLVRELEHPCISYVRPVIENKRRFYENIIAKGHEGIVLKDMRQPYLNGQAWIRFKPELDRVNTAETS